MLMAITDFDKLSLAMAGVAALIGIAAMIALMAGSFKQKPNKH